jgi:hypothetical protein
VRTPSPTKQEARDSGPPAAGVSDDRLVSNRMPEGGGSCSQEEKAGRHFPVIGEGAMRINEMLDELG